MFCENCGKELKDDALFCPKCGYRTDVMEPGNDGLAGVSTVTETKPGQSNLGLEGASAEVSQNIETSKNMPSANIQSVNIQSANIPPQPATGKGKKWGIIGGTAAGVIAIAALVIVLVVNKGLPFGSLFANSASENGTGLWAEDGENPDNAGENKEAGENGEDNGDAEGNAEPAIAICCREAIYNEGLSNVALVLKNGHDNPDGDVVCEVTTQENGIAEMPFTTGEYTLCWEVDGYYSGHENITIGDGGIYLVKHLVPYQTEQKAYVLLEWEADKDLDLCVYNAQTNQYINIIHPTDDLGNFLYNDNTGAHGYELIYLRDYTAGVYTIYVRDDDSLIAGTTSEMESGGVTVSIYTADGLLYQSKAAENQTAALWSPVYLYQGQAYELANYITDLTDYAWATRDKSDDNYVEYVELSLEEKITEMNSPNYSKARIDIFANNYATGTRNALATWDRTVFYCLEGYQTVDGYMNKDSCTLRKMEMINSQTGNIIQYDIYVNPLTGIFNKIVSIEYLQNGLEITEYYYDNNGKVNFIFRYNIDNYISSYATPNKPGERYLFQNDCLVTWRVITDSQTTNFVIGNAEAERMQNQFARNTMVFYDSLSAEQKTAYDSVEKNMINAAYNTYNTVLNNEGIARIQGFVYDGYGNGMSQAEVELYDSTFSTLLYTASTDSNGMYTIYVPNQEYEYNIRIGKSGMSSSDIYLIKMNNEQIGAYQDSVYLFDASANTATVNLTLGDAFEYASDGGMLRLSNATVYCRQGVNNRSGEIVWEGAANNSGNVSLNLAPGVYTIEITAYDYETMYYTIVANPIRGTCTYEFYATPVLEEGQYAIVLTWGQYPYDLDSHLFTTAGTTTDHIWFGDKSDDFGSYLDVDDTSSYGPETVTMFNFNASYYYKYCVVDYSDCVRGYYNSMEMSNSMACVNVYSSEGLIATFNVPTGKEGVIWEVFEIRNGHITPIQRYYGNVEDMTWWHSDK